MQGQGDNAGILVVSYFTVRLNNVESVKTPSARADDKLANSIRVCYTGGGLWAKPLVEVIVTGEDHVGLIILQGLPNGAHEPIVAVSSRTEQRMVPISQRTLGRIRGQIGAQPQLLRRTRLTTADLCTIAVERDQVPNAQVETIIPFVRWAGGHAKITKITGRACGVIFVVACSRKSDRLELAPGWFIGFLELVQRAILILIIAHRQHRRWIDLGQQVGGGFHATFGGSAQTIIELLGGGVASNVTRAGDHRVAVGSWSERGSGSWRQRRDDGNESFDRVAICCHAGKEGTAQSEGQDNGKDKQTLDSAAQSKKSR